VLELEDLEDGAVDLDVVSILELVGVDDGRSVLLEPDFQCRSSIARSARRLDHDSCPRPIERTRPSTLRASHNASDRRPHLAWCTHHRIRCLRR
jgi:hypothetical protein